MKVLKSACQYHLLGSSGVFMQSYVIYWYNLDQLVFATTNSEYLKFDIENYYCKNNKCRRCLLPTYATVSGNMRKNER